MVLLKTKGVKLLLLSVIFFAVTQGVYSSEEYTKSQSLSVSGAYYIPDHMAYELSGDFAPVSYSKISADNSNQRDLGSTWGSAEIKATYKLSLSKDFLTGGSALTKDNQLKYTFIGEISPVSIEAGAEVTLTPIAFLDISLGSTVASGWKAVGVNGLGLNNKNNSLPDDSPFQGALFQSWISGTIKFDLAVLLSGDTTWKHIVLLSSHKLQSRYFSAAGNNDPWIYQGGEGDKLNGFIYKHTTFVGYQMPLVLEKVGFLIETESNLFSNNTVSKMSDGGWGSDFIKLRLGALLNFKINNAHSITILPQFTTARRYTDATNREIYFKNREVNTNSPTYWDFERVALIYTYKF